MRTLLALVAVSLVPSAVIADDKKEEVTNEKLVGKWQSGKDGDTVVTVMEFTKDGAVTRTVTLPEEKPRVFKGTWKLDGAKLTTTLKSGGKDKVETVEVTKLTDKAIELKTKDGTAVKMERMTEK